MRQDLHREYVRVRLRTIGPPPLGDCIPGVRQLLRTQLARIPRMTRVRPGGTSLPELDQARAIERSATRLVSIGQASLAEVALLVGHALSAGLASPLADACPSRAL